MFNFLLLYNALLILNAFLVNAQVSNLRLCGNKECTAVIGEGKTLRPYATSVRDSRLLSFQPNEHFKIYSKEAGSNANLWGIEIKGKRGYAPLSFLKETRAILKPNVTVPVEPPSNDVPSITTSETLQPTNAYEVVDGTTIYNDPHINPSSTEKSVQPSIHSNVQQTESLSYKGAQNSQNDAHSLQSDQYNNGKVASISELHQSSSPIQGVHVSAPQSTPEVDISEPSTLNEKLTSEGDSKELLKSDQKEGTIEKKIELKLNEIETSETNNKHPPLHQEQENIESKPNEKVTSESDNEQPPQLHEKGENIETKSNEKEASESDNKRPQHLDQKKEIVEEKIESKSNEKETSESDSEQPPELDQNEDKIESNEKVTFENDNEQLLKLDQKNGIGNEEKISATEGNQYGDSLVQTDGQDRNLPALISEPSMVNNIISSIKGFIDSEEEDDEDSSVEEEDEDEDAEVESAADEEVTLQGEGKTPMQEEENKNVESRNIQTETKPDIIIEDKLQSEYANQVIAEQSSEKVSITSHQVSENSSDSSTKVQNGHNTNLQFGLNGASIQEKDTDHTYTSDSDGSIIPTKYDAHSQSSKYESELQHNGDSFSKVNKYEIEATRDNNGHTHNFETKSEIEEPTAAGGGYKEFEMQSSTNYLDGLSDQDFEHEHNKNDDAISSQNNIKDMPSSNNYWKLDEEHGHFDTFDKSASQADGILNSETGAAEALGESAIATEFNSQETIVDEIELHKHDINTLLSHQRTDELSCTADCKIEENTNDDIKYTFELPVISYKILIVLVITAVTVVVFLWGYAYIDKRGREGILIGKINDLQKQFLITQKENELLTNKLTDIKSEFEEKSNTISSEAVLNLRDELEQERKARSALEAQMKTLEKDLENSTEVGLELNRMLSQFLSSENGSETLVANIEQLQRQIVEQQDLINSYNDNLNMKETENHELRLEVDINNTKVIDLQSELNKMALNLLKLEEDRDASQSMYENQLENLKVELEERRSLLLKETNKFKEQMKDLNDNHDQLKRDFELKSNEYSLLRENINQIKKMDSNSDSIKALLDISAVQAEVLQLRKDKQLLIEQVQIETNKNCTLEGQYQVILKDLGNTKQKYDLADREKVEAVTKLEVLDKYFKEREAQLQRELSKQETMWIEKQGEATSTIERIKYMQEELQNYKAQNESLKQEILEQEVQMRSQISMLEKKAHENWVTARQLERKLDDAKQESAQLRNRLTLQERTINEEKLHNRIQSPIEHNGEIQVTPSHIPNDTAASPPLMFGARENLTMSPSLPGLPFLPPPPGVPFMPPPLGGVPLPPPSFMPPPPSLLPGDHRPPPLGRISSPPLNSRFPHDRAYSPYSRNSPSPTSDDEYDRMPMPPMYGGYYNSFSREDRRDLHRAPPPMLSNTRNSKGAGHSSGSANSTESLEKINRHNSKV